MENLVSFLMIDTKTEINYCKNYIEDILENLKEKGIISNFIVHSSNEIVEEYDEHCFKSQFVMKSNDSKSTNWMIDFAYGTFEGEKQLKINISSDNYGLSKEDKILHNLKITLKNILTVDWKNIVWLYDAESELLATSIYPLIYQTENLTRRFINEVMIKTFGVRWWDEFIPHKIKEKHRGRLNGYKSIVTDFKNVDEKLLSIDTGDLVKILFLTKTKWTPSFNEEIDNLLNNKIEISEEKLKKLLKDQSTPVIDLWDEIFSNYLPSDFKKKYKDFEKNRNHVMHNKLLDFTALKIIEDSINEVSEIMEKALNNANQLMISKERQDSLIKAIYMEELEEEEEELELELEELYQEEAGVEVKKYDQVIEHFEDILQSFFNDLDDDLRYNDYLTNDITVSLDVEVETILLTLTRNFDDKQLNLYAEIESIGGGQGETSTISLYFKETSQEKFYISYVNGEYYFNEEQGNHMPVTEEYDDFAPDELSDYILNAINDYLPNLKEVAESESFQNIMGGGSPVIIEGDVCEECSEEAVYIGSEIDEVEFGQCLNCGEYNTISNCARCEQPFVGGPGEDFDEFDEEKIVFCDSCIEYMKNQ